MGRSSSADRQPGRVALVALAALLVCGCTPGGVREESGRLLDSSLVPVVNRADAPLGVGAVVRVTYDRVGVARAPPPREVRGLLALGDERVAADVERVGPLALLRAARGVHDLRPLLAAVDAPADAPVQAALMTRERRILLVRTAVQGSDGAATVSLPLEGTRGGVVLSPQRALVGFLAGELDGAPRLLPWGRVQRQVVDVTREVPGAEHLYPEDGFLTSAVSAPRRLTWSQVPRIPDAWGDPDVFVALEQGDQRLALLEVTPGRADMGTHVLRLLRRASLAARLVERDLTLTGGEAEEDLADPVRFDLAEREVILPFRLRPDAIERAEPAPSEEEGSEPPPAPGAVVEVPLTVDPIDPERASGDDCTPLGATSLPLRRVGADTVHLLGGDATDFWCVEPDAPATGTEEPARVPLLALLYRHRPDSGVTVEAFSLRRGDPLWRSEGGSRRHLLVARVERGGGAPLLLRVRHWGERPEPCPYSVLVFPRDEDPAPLVRSLFRLVGREAGRTRAPFLGSRAFAREVFQVLVTEAGYPREALSAALLEVLGHRIREARHLALHLLEVFVPPSLSELERVRAEAERSSHPDERRRSLDAGLLVALRIATARDFRAYIPIFVQAVRAEAPERYPQGALRDPHLLQRAQQETLASLHRTVLEAARDPDQRIRLRALATAARLAYAKLLGALGDELRGVLADDPSLAVRRALASTFPGGRRAGEQKK